MKVIKDLSHYKTSSKDYNLLWEQLQVKGIICILDTGIGENSRQQVARTVFFDNYAQVSTEGVTYIDARNKEDFTQQCKKTNLQWLIPN